MKIHLYTRAGVVGYSIDIRSDGGYIVAPPSSMNGNYYKIVNNVDMSALPLELAKFLKGLDDINDKKKVIKLNTKLQTVVKEKLEDADEDTTTEQRRKKAKHYLDNFTFVMSDNDIKKLLDLLPPGHDDDFLII